MPQEPIQISGDGSEYLGKRLLVGVTVNSADGEFLYREQFHGLIVAASSACVVIERADNGARVSFPPLLEEAPRGNYKLESTGEVIADPDYLARWTWTEGGPETKGVRTD